MQQAEPNWSALNEKGLLLKRQKRFSEAEEIFQNIIKSGPPSLKSIAVGNLGSLYVERGEAERAVSLLEGPASKEDVQAALLGVLGQAYDQTGKYEQAKKVWTRTLALNPRIQFVPEMFAALLMNRMGDVQAAFSVLDASFDQGTITANGIARLWTAALLLLKLDICEALEETLQSQLPEKQYREVEAASMKMVEDFVKANPGYKISAGAKKWGSYA